MIIPISTDAPIYYWPWMTLVLIGVNVVVFLATGFGVQVDGWQVSYGQGLHPLEWVAYNFFHYNWFHLIGNMFFLWGFGIVVEGKLGWWKYLLLYLGIGIVGGIIIQVLMLGFVDPHAEAKEQFEKQLQQIQQQQQPGQVPPQIPQPVPQQPAPAEQVTPVPQAVAIPQAMNVSLLFAFVQQTGEAPQPAESPTVPNDPLVPPAQPVVPDQPGQFPVMQPPGAPAGQFPNGVPNDEDMEFDPAADGPELDDSELGGIQLFRKPGAAGASLVIYALLAITLVWAPKNEITCFVLRVPPGTFEIEYMYFCGIRIVAQIIYAAVYGFQMSSELGHAVGAVAGFGAGTLFLKQNWVDCENWDLFAVLKGTHGNRASIGGWRENASHSISTPTSPADSERPKKSKKKTTAFRASIYDAADSPKKSSAKTGSKSRSKQSRTDEPDEDDVELEGWENFDDEAADAAEAVEILDDEDSFDEPAPPPKKKLSAATSTSASRGATKSTEKPAATKTSDAASPTDQIRSALHAGQVADALNRYREQKNASPNWTLGETELAGLCDGLYKAQQRSDAVPLMEECLARFPQTSVRIRLKLAAIFADVQRRPRAALKLLAQVSRDTLPEKLQPQYDKIRKLSQKLIDMNVEDRKG